MMVGDGKMLSHTILQSVPVRKASRSLHKLAIIFKSVRLARALKKVVRVSDLERKVSTLTNRKWS